MGNGKRESNGCTVHFNSILQLLYINHKVSIKLWLNLKSAKKHLSFFIVLYFIVFLLHLNITRVFFSFFFSVKLLLDHTSATCTTEVSSIFLHLVALKWREKGHTIKQTMKNKKPKTKLGRARGLNEQKKGQRHTSCRSSVLGVCALLPSLTSNKTTTTATTTKKRHSGALLSLSNV